MSSLHMLSDEDILRTIAGGETADVIAHRLGADDDLRGVVVRLNRLRLTGRLERVTPNDTPLARWHRV